MHCSVFTYLTDWHTSTSWHSELAFQGWQCCQKLKCFHSITSFANHKSSCYLILILWTSIQQETLPLRAGFINVLRVLLHDLWTLITLINTRRHKTCLTTTSQNSWSAVGYIPTRKVGSYSVSHFALRTGEITKWRAYGCSVSNMGSPVSLFQAFAEIHTLIPSVNLALCFLETHFRIEN